MNKSIDLDKPMITKEIIGLFGNIMQKFPEIFPVYDILINNEHNVGELPKHERTMLFISAFAGLNAIVESILNTPAISSLDDSSIINMSVRHLIVKYINVFEPKEKLEEVLDYFEQQITIKKK